MSTKAAKVIFNDGGSNQTADLAIDPDARYYDGEWKVEFPQEEPQEPEEWDGTVTFDLSAIDYLETDGCIAFLYVYYVDGSDNEAFPGVAMDKVEGSDVLWTGKVDTTKTIAGMVVARCSADGNNVYNQTGDITNMPDNHLIVIEWMQEVH